MERQQNEIQKDIQGQLKQNLDRAAVEQIQKLQQEIANMKQAQAAKDAAVLKEIEDIRETLFHSYLARKRLSAPGHTYCIHHCHDVMAVPVEIVDELRDGPGLAAFPERHRKQLMGEIMYAAIFDVQVQMAKIITGWLVDRVAGNTKDIAAFLAMMENRDELREVVAEHVTTLVNQPPFL